MSTRDRMDIQDTSAQWNTTHPWKRNGLQLGSALYLDLGGGYIDVHRSGSSSGCLKAQFIYTVYLHSFGQAPSWAQGDAVTTVPATGHSGLPLVLHSCPSMSPRHT